MTNEREKSKMPSRALWLPLAALLSAALAACGGGQAGGGSGTPPGNAVSAPATNQAGGPKPSEIKFDIRPAPQLGGTGDEAKKAVHEFLDWAAASTVDQREDGRAAIAAASANDAVAGALADEAFLAAKEDHSRALVALAVLGELRNPVGQEALNRFVNQPLPSAGTEVDGVIQEQEDLATLEAKAVEGLAYMKNGTAEEQTLAAISQHPSRVVRAAAIEAFIYNFCGTNLVRANPCSVLPRYVHKDELIFIDRPSRLETDSAEAFNGKLATFLHAHPEIAAPNPETGDSDQGPKLDPTLPGLPPER